MGSGWWDSGAACWRELGLVSVSGDWLRRSTWRAATLVLGTITSLRVHNARADDVAMLARMNRLRGGYVDLDPGIEAYFVTSRHDDRAGVMVSYLMGTHRSAVGHVSGSTGMFVNIVKCHGRWNSGGPGYEGRRCPGLADRHRRCGSRPRLSQRGLTGTNRDRPGLRRR